MSPVSLPIIFRFHRRFKNGKDHCYWSIAEKVRTSCGWVQRRILYLAEINDNSAMADLLDEDFALDRTPRRDVPARAMSNRKLLLAISLFFW